MASPYFVVPHPNGYDGYQVNTTKEQWKTSSTETGQVLSHNLHHPNTCQPRVSLAPVALQVFYLFGGGATFTSLIRQPRIGQL